MQCDIYGGRTSFPKKIMELKCLKCRGCIATHKNEHMKGYQRYKCKGINIQRQRHVENRRKTRSIWIINERYGQNRWGNNINHDAKNTSFYTREA